jgi:hypothetical protein
MTIGAMSIKIEEAAEAVGEAAAGSRAVGAEKRVGAGSLVGAGLEAPLVETTVGTTVIVEGAQVNNFRAQARSIKHLTISEHPRGA